MIVLDTHIWLWWVDGSTRLTAKQTKLLQEHELQGLGISVISCWEIAKLVEYQRLVLSCPITELIDQALEYPDICLPDLTPQIAIESTRLPPDFHRDSADQLIVATARVHGCLLLTADTKILNYAGVTTS